MRQQRWRTRIPTAADRARDAKYNSPEHRAARASLALVVANGTARCWRCGGRITGDWHVGHDDLHTEVIRGAEHAACNLSAAGRKGVAVADAARRAATFARPPR